MNKNTVWAIVLSALVIFVSYFKPRLSLAVVSGAIPHCGVWASHCGRFSSCGAQTLGEWALAVVVQA